MDSPTKEHFESISVTLGSPSIHNAEPNRNTKFSSFQVFEFGEPGVNAERKTILLVGRTGTGKSTLINSFFNYIMGVEWSHKRRYNFLQDKETTSDKSKTQRITAYTLHHNDAYRSQYTWTVIDTPGFDNTDLSDEEIAEQLREFLHEAPNAGIHHIHAVGFTVSASLKFFNDVENFISKTLKELFRPDIHTNLCFLVTFADLKAPAIAAVNRSGIPLPHHISFNNSALYSQRKSQQTNETKKDEKMKKVFWRKGRDGCKQLLKYASDLTEIALKKTISALADMHAQNCPQEKCETETGNFTEQPVTETFQKEKYKKETGNPTEQTFAQNYPKEKSKKEAWNATKEPGTENYPQEKSKKEQEYMKEQVDDETYPQEKSKKELENITEQEDGETYPYEKVQKEVRNISEQTVTTPSTQDKLMNITEQNKPMKHFATENDEESIDGCRKESLMTLCEGIISKKIREVRRDDSLMTKLLKLRKEQYQSSPCPMTIHKNWRRYIGTVSRGEAKRLQGDDSDVSLNVPSGAPGIYICRVHTDHTRFTRHGIVPESECIIGPFAEFKFKALQNTSDADEQKSPEAFYKICIPHCLPERELWKDVKVRHGHIFPDEDGQVAAFQEIPRNVDREMKEQFDGDMCYDINEHFIQIITKKFCHFTCTVCENRCNLKTLILLFGNLAVLPEQKTSVEIKAFLCSNLYSIHEYKAGLIETLKREDNLHKLKEKTFVLQKRNGSPAEARTKLTIEPQSPSRQLNCSWNPIVQKSDFEWDPDNKIFTKEGVLADVMDFDGCHRCRENYSHEAMAVDLEIRQRVTEFEGIFRIEVEAFQGAVPFIISEITNEVKDQRKQSEQNNNLQKNDSPELTWIHITEVSRQITKKSDLRYLGTKLGVHTNTVDTAIHDNPGDINEAVYSVLQQWLSNERDGKAAFQKLTTALQNAQLANIINCITSRDG